MGYSDILQEPALDWCSILFPHNGQVIHIELIEITGDKCIILHKEKTRAYVVMKFEDYKRFYKNRLYPSENEVQLESQTESIKTKPRPIPPKPVDVRQFEIKNQIPRDFDQDIYYPEPLIE